LNEKYICSFCGTEYDTATARARCELECDEKRKQEIEREHRRKLKEEKKERLAELENARKHYDQLVKAYIKDYQTEICLDDFFNTKLFFGW